MLFMQPFCLMATMSHNRAFALNRQSKPSGFQMLYSEERSASALKNLPDTSQAGSLSKPSGIGSVYSQYEELYHLQVLCIQH